MLYMNSWTEYEGDTLLIAKENGVKSLYVRGNGEIFNLLDGETLALPGGPVKRCPLSNQNAGVIQKCFPFTKPVSRKGRPFSVGLGDRLGLASPGHLRLIKDMDVFPVLAQQSIRELTLTGRRFEDVLSAAVWAVFQEGYRSGWGADGDHLKTGEEVKMALDCGYTMITLDCSEHINQGLEAVVRFAIEIYDKWLRGKDVDFELSIDETTYVTSPEDHAYVAGELKKANVELSSLAPRFCGEFQKGIDYRGDVAQFEKEFITHAQIAKENGYKLSIHSGSDKFTVFPIIYKNTGKNVHVKTAGTNWLEALKVIAENEPELFRKIWTLALNGLPEAKKYYHITENTANIPDVAGLSDAELPGLFGLDDARQVLHVTYGITLGEHKTAIFAALNRYEDEYYAALYQHIGRHLPACD